MTDQSNNARKSKKASPKERDGVFYTQPHGSRTFRNPISFTRPELRTEAEQAALDALQNAGPRQYSVVARRLMGIGAMIERFVLHREDNGASYGEPEAMALVAQRCQAANGDFIKELLRLACVGAMTEMHGGLAALLGATVRQHGDNGAEPRAPKDDLDTSGLIFDLGEDGAEGDGPPVDLDAG